MSEETVNIVFHSPIIQKDGDTMENLSKGSQELKSNDSLKDGYAGPALTHFFTKMASRILCRGGIGARMETK